MKTTICENCGIEEEPLTEGLCPDCFNEWQECQELDEDAQDY